MPLSLPYTNPLSAMLVFGISFFMIAIIACFEWFFYKDNIGNWFSDLLHWIRVCQNLHIASGHGFFWEPGSYVCFKLFFLTFVEQPFSHPILPSSFFRLLVIVITVLEEHHIMYTSSWCNPAIELAVDCWLCFFFSFLNSVCFLLFLRKPD